MKDANKISSNQPIVTQQPVLRSTTRGLGIAEVLVVSGIGIIIGMGSLKSLEITVQVANQVKTELEEQALSAEIKNFFSDEAHCIATLKPARLAEDDRALQKGILLNSAGTALKTIGNFKPSFISIERVELLHEGSDKSYSKRTLAVLYKKLYVGGQNTLGGKACSVQDKSGCYHQTCILDYKCSNDECSGGGADENSRDKCIPLTCHSGKGLRGVSCEDEDEDEGSYYLTGFIADGKADCQLLSGGCKTGKVISGFWKAGETKPDGKSTGDPKCSPVVIFSAASTMCPEGQVLREIGSGGTLVCTGVCGAKQRWDGTQCVCAGGSQATAPPNRRCECPSTRPNWNNNQCESCPSGETWSSSCDKCKPNSCGSGYSWNNSSCSCECTRSCTAGYTLNSSSCTCENRCIAGYSWSSSCNKCKPNSCGSRIWRNCRCESTCNRSCGSGYTLNRSRCRCECTRSCPDHQQLNSSCRCVNKCPNSNPKSSSVWLSSCNNCKLNCSPGFSWRNCGCRSDCPSGQYWSPPGSSSGRCCNKYWHLSVASYTVNGIRYSYRKCCRAGEYVAHGSRCCKSGEYNTPTDYRCRR